MLKELAEDGLIADPRRSLRKEAVPSVTVLTVREQTRDGDLSAVPSHWDEEEDGPAPGIRLEVSRRYEGPAIGVGDRVLARLREADGDGDGDERRFQYIASPIKVLPREKVRQLGLLRTTGSRLIVESVDKKDMKEWHVVPGEAPDAMDGELVRFETVRDPRAGRAMARIVERVGHPKSEKAVSLIAIHNHGLRDAFPDDVVSNLQLLPLANGTGREDLTRLPLVTIDPEDAKDHDDAVWANSR